MTPTPRNDSWYEPPEYETCPQCDDDSIHRDVCLNGDCGFTYEPDPDADDDTILARMDSPQRP